MSHGRIGCWDFHGRQELILGVIQLKVSCPFDRPLVIINHRDFKNIIHGDRGSTGIVNDYVPFMAVIKHYSSLIDNQMTSLIKLLTIQHRHDFPADHDSSFRHSGSLFNHHFTVIQPSAIANYSMTQLNHRTWFAMKPLITSSNSTITALLLELPGTTTCSAWARASQPVTLATGGEALCSCCTKQLGKGGISCCSTCHVSVGRGGNRGGNRGATD